MSVKPIPDGYHTITPYLVVDDPGRAIAFMKAAFGGESTECVSAEDGSVMHAEVRVGTSVVMIGRARPGQGAQPAMLYMYVTDCESTYRKALEAGGTSVMPPAKQFYGDMNAGVTDPCGISWWIATHVEDVPKDELMRRAREQKG